MKLQLLKDFKFMEDGEVVQKKKGDLFEAENHKAFISAKVAKKAPRKKVEKVEEETT